MTTPAVPETLALAASRNLTFTIEGIAVCGNTTPAVIRLLFVLTFTANQATSGFHHTISTPFFLLLGIFYHYEHDNCYGNHCFASWSKPGYQPFHAGGIGYAAQAFQTCNNALHFLHC
jgi:hypothetical protein